jgi:hypothetical protein
LPVSALTAILVTEIIVFFCITSGKIFVRVAERSERHTLHAAPGVTGLRLVGRGSFAASGGKSHSFLYAKQLIYTSPAFFLL